MGYTHSWYRPRRLDAATFEHATLDIQMLYNSFLKPRLFKSFSIGPDFVRIEGGGETFQVEALSMERERNGIVFEFCKTQHLPYDLPVMCCLLVFRHHLGPTFKVCSNGDLPNWQPAIDLVSKVLGWKSTWPFHEEEKDGLVDRWIVETQAAPA